MAVAIDRLREVPDALPTRRSRYLVPRKRNTKRESSPRVDGRRVARRQHRVQQVLHSKSYSEVRWDRLDLTIRTLSREEFPPNVVPRFKHDGPWESLSVAVYGYWP